MNLLMLIMLTAISSLSLFVSLVHTIRAIVYDSWHWGMITLYVITASFFYLFYLQYRDYKKEQTLKK